MLQATARTITVLFLFIFSFQFSFAGTPPTNNDECANATVLTLGTTLANETVKSMSASAGMPAPCSGNPDDDVWYKFTLSSTTSITVTLSSIGSNLSSSGAMVQLFSGTCPSGFSSLACGAIEISYANLASGTYYVRVFSAGTGNIASGANFDITVTGPPANDDCAGAVTLSNGVTNTSGTVWNASASSGIPTGCATGTPDDDVWYKFTPSNTELNISLSVIGTNLSTSGARLQLFSGTCGSLTSYACGTTSIVTTVVSGTTYYIRVYSAGNGSIGGISSGSAFDITATATAAVLVTAGRMNEVYKQTILSGSGVLQYPWEITYGPDDNLWITESKGYKVYTMDPNTGVKTTVLDISQGSVTSPDVTFNCQFANGAGAQGGLAGLALHPQFLDGTNLHDFVYISYIYSAGANTDPNGIFFTNRLVRFTYNTVTGKLESPVSLCDTLPGSSDHNSQRIIIAPVAGTYYLFYAQGDMGAGQFGNRLRPNKAQAVNSYEGKILRFNLEPDLDGGTLDKWIPNNNPFNATLGVQSAVWVTGIRNNQGFAYDTSSNTLYGASHGPFSDDEINIIESGKNYGHPLVIGFAADGNVNGTTAGNAPGMTGGSTSSCPMIVSEAANAATIGSSYKDPLFSGYPVSPDFPSIPNLWNTTTGGNALWPTETWSGIDLYTNKVIPGWKHSLVTSSLKWGRLVRLKLGAAGTTTLPNNAVSDTITYFQSKNRFRDLAFSPNGKDVYVIMDNNAATSGPGQLNPIVPACAGCVQKYTFLGYADAGGKSTIPTSIDVTDGTVNTCNTGTTVTIDASNNNLWVPITGPDGNIMAEIYANGNNLGTVTSSFYKNSGAIRIKSGNHYLDRNMTITPQTQPSTAVKIRLYISKAEFDALDADVSSLVNAITDLKILKNSDACGNAISGTTTLITPTYAEAHGANGYMLQGNISGFSSFYFSSSNIALPVDLLTFSGSLQNNGSVLLNWKTEHEINASHFEVERSIDASHFNGIGNVLANGNTSSVFDYSFTDVDASNQQSLVLYYRLKLVDRDGSFKYSNIITISLADITGKISVSPNPVLSDVKVTISSPADGRIQWKLIDNTGRVILQNSDHVRKGNGNSFTINMNKLARGYYYLSVSGTGIDQKVKLQKL